MNSFKHIIAIAALGLAALNPAKAFTNPSDSEILGKRISQQLVIPIQLVECSQKVEVLFTTNEKGDVNFTLVKPEKLEMKKYLEHYFSKLNLPSLKSNVVYNVVLNIKVK